MVSEFLPYLVPMFGVAICSAWCAIWSLCTARANRLQVYQLNQRLIALEQAPTKVIVQGPIPPVYYQPPPVVQPKPSAPPPAPSPYSSFYPPYSSAYQGQQLPVAR